MKSLRILHDVALAPEGRSAALLLRHADRNGPQERMVDKNESLNDSGRRRAAELGKALKRFDMLHLLSSPVGRCVETCERIAEGYGEHVPVETSEAMGPRAPFLLRPEEAYNMMRTMGLFSFVEAYVNGRIDPRVAVPCPEGTRMMLSFALSRIRDAGNCAVVMVTHDMVLTPALVKYFGHDVRRNGLVPFLDGFVLYSSDYGFRLAHGGKVLKVTKEGELRA